LPHVARDHRRNTHGTISTTARPVPRPRLDAPYRDNRPDPGVQPAYIRLLLGRAAAQG
jgi:hypothetical protein